MIYLAFSCNGVMMVIIAIVNPKSPEFLSSLFLKNISENSIGQEIAVRVASLAFQLWILYNVYSAIFVATMTSVACACLLLAAINELSDKRRSVTSAKLSQSVTRITAWRTISILLVDYNEVFAIGIVGTKVFLIFLAVFNAYGAITFQGVIALVLGYVGVSLTTFLLILFTILQGFHENTTRVLEDWRCNTQSFLGGNKSFNCTGTNAKETLIYKKCLKSLKSISLTVNGMYCIDKLMVISMFRFILESTVNFVLMYR